MAIEHGGIGKVVGFCFGMMLGLTLFNGESARAQTPTAAHMSALAGMSNLDHAVADNGRIEFQSGYLQIGETETVLELSVVRSDGSAGPVSIDYSSCCGTATPGMDYEAVSGTLSWADGDITSKTILVPIHDDGEIEASESFAVSLSGVTGGAIIANTATTIVQIDDTDFATHGRIEFQSGYLQIGETGTLLELSVVRGEGSIGAVSIDYSSCCGTATPGLDYEAVFGTLFWADGDGTPKTILVPIHDDGEIEASESFVVSLSGVSGGAIIANTVTSVVQIDDDDVADHGRIEFQSGYLQIGETETLLELSVVRGEGSVGAVSVGYSSCCGTAAPGMDYEAVSGTLFWADGDSMPKTILVPIHDDGELEASESFVVSLSGVTGGAVIANAATAVVQIDDDDSDRLFNSGFEDRP